MDRNTPQPSTTPLDLAQNDFLVLQANLAGINARFEGARMGGAGIDWASTVEKLLAGLIRSLTGGKKDEP